jgi:Protein of unknown function (DUF2442)
MTIPRRMIPGLEGQPAAALNVITLSPAGDALLWPSLDADIYLPRLVERVFGSRLFSAGGATMASGAPRSVQASDRLTGVGELADAEQVRFRTSFVPTAQPTISK